MYRFNAKKTMILVFFPVLFSLMPLYAADVQLGRIADDSALRSRLAGSWLDETPIRVMAMQRATHTLDGGGRVQVRVEEGRTEFMVVFARELMRGRPGERPVGTGQFPFYTQGSWMLTRRKDNGEAVRIGVYLRSDPNIYIQFRPFNNERCQMDVVLYNAYVVRSLTLPVPFQRLYTMPLNDILSLAADRFPRRYFEPDPSLYVDHRQFISNVRGKLSGLRYVNDGAVDADGRYVFINTGLPQQGQPGLNCSGFIKWLIDGVLRPVTGERLAIQPLKAPFGDRGSSFTDPYEELRDPFFGLDWIRNLAAQAGSVLRSPTYSNLEIFEVRSGTFSQMINRQGGTTTVITYPGFHANAGYGIEGLHPLLYQLAIDEPGNFYLAAVNNEMGPQTNTRGQPRMRQYFHVAALVPYFDENGFFQIAVFESIAQTSFSTFRNRYSAGHHVNLVRIPLETAFDP